MREEDKIFNMIDSFKEEEMIPIIEKIEPNNKPEIPRKTIDNIKQKTYKKIAVSPCKLKKPKTIRNIWGTIAASLLLLTVLSTAIVGPNEAWARVKQALQFIPGMGIVLEDDKEILERYILKSPVEKEIEETNNGKIRVEGIIVDQQQTVVTISGWNIPVNKNIVFLDKNGAEYAATGYTVSSSGGGPDNILYWKGTYVYNGYIPEAEELGIILADSNHTVIALSLEKAQTFSSYDEMGPTDSVNDFSITAIAAMEGEQLKINLISPSRDGMKIKAYGAHPGFGGNTITLTDTQGKEYNIDAPQSYSPPLSEFYFDLEGTEQKEFTLSIPFIEVIYQEEQAEITLDIPREGSADINQIVQLADYLVVLEKVDRFSDINGDNIRIHVDVNYEEDKEKTLQAFSFDVKSSPFPWIKKPTSGSSSYTIDEKTGAMKSFTINLEPDAKEIKSIKLLLNDPVVVIQGPWNLDISLQQ